MNGPDLMNFFHRPGWRAQLLATALITTTANAAITFTGTGNFETAGNWSDATGPTVPGANTNRWNINGTATYNNAGTTSNADSRTLSVGNGNGNTGVLNVEDGLLSINNSSSALISAPTSTGTASGTLNLNGGDVTLTGELSVLSRGGAAATGTLNVNNGSTLTTDILSFGVLAGSSGTGTINLNAGGTIETRVLFERSNVNDIVNLDGGTLRATSDATNWFRSNLDDVNILAGGVTLDSGSATAARVSALLEGSAGGDVLITDSVGNGAIQFEADNTYDGDTTIDTGATLILGNDGTTGTIGTGTLTNNGTLSFNRSDDLVQSSSGATAPIAGGLSSGNLKQEGSGKLTLDVANTYTGTTTVTDGTLEVTHADAVQNTSGITVEGGGTFQVENGVDISEDITIAGGGEDGVTGALRGGTTAGNTFSGNVTINNGSTRIGTVDGGNLTVSGDISDGGEDYNTTYRPGANGTITISGNANYGGQTVFFGGSDDSGTLVVGSGTAVNSDGRLVFSRGTVDLNGQTVTGTGLNSNSGTGSTITNGVGGAATLVLNLPDADTRTTDSVIQDGVGTVALIKGGNGTQTLTGASTFTGGTTVSAGTLYANGTLGDVNVTGGTLGGNGTVADVTVGAAGTLAAGTSIGTLTTDSATIGGTLAVEYDDDGGQTIDLLNVTGLLDLTGSTVDFIDISSGTIGLSEPSYVFATYGSLTGTFDTVLNLPTSYVLDYAFGGNNIALVQVPEPSVILLGALGLLGVTRRRRTS